VKLPQIAARAAPGQGAVQLLRLVFGLWDRLAIYLPLVLMGLLSLLTYWMVRITPALTEPEEVRVAVHEVDFYMRGARVKTYDKDGRLQAQLFGAEIRHYGDNEAVEIDQPRWQSSAPDGRITVATARRAISLGDGSEVKLLGDAVVVRQAWSAPRSTVQPRLEYRSEYLHIFARDERVQSHLPVRFFSGRDEFAADSFRYDHLGRTIELEGRAAARLWPRANASSAERQSP
jgi:lipopolysaccharide export system protein LptC